jgi:AraC-like DNA-binding protein
MSRTYPVAPKPTAKRFHKGLCELGIDTDTLYLQLNIDPVCMKSEDGSLSMGAYFSLLNLASKLSGKRFLGVELASALDSDELGILVYLIRNARNFEHVLDILRRYITLVSPGSEVSLIESEHDLVLTYGFGSTSLSECYQDAEGTIAQFVLMIREVIRDQKWQPERIYFSHSAINADDAGEFPMGKTVVFDHPYSGVLFPSSIVRYPIENSDAKLLSILEAQVELSASNLLSLDSTLDRVRLLITSGIGSSAVKSDDIASALGISRRTLHRRLRERGITYNKLREEIVLDLAKASLTGTSASIATIAQELSYSDSSAFNRIFKRLAGCTPLQYRKMHATKWSRAD